MILQIKVKPGARISRLTQSDDGTWVAQIKSPPVDGKANAELISLVAEQFQCSRSSVRIRHGSAGRIKLVEIAEGESAAAGR